MRSILFITALRGPLLCALALASLAPLGAFSFSPSRGMLEGLFDVSGWVAFWVATASSLTAAACWLCSLLTLNYGPRRIPGLHRTATDLEFRAFPWLAVAFSLAPLSVLNGICALSADPVQVVSGSAAGFATSLAAWTMHRRACRSLPVRPARYILAGYVDEATRQLLPGHWLATQFTILFVALWVLTGLLKYYALTIERPPLVLPTSLTFVILLIGLLVLLLSGMAFFFDRYRIPILLPCLSLLGVTSAIPTADQFVETLPIPTRTLPQPVALLREVPAPILVCASGGGIAAAAWTATVLTSLQRLNPSSFVQSLVLFSGASGGSVGGMQFVAACRSPRGCTVAPETASRSSLDAAAWGLVGPDFIRATVPFAGAALGNLGRGWALEQSWDAKRALRFPLSTWPTRPAVVFNTTMVETGEGIGLGNVDLGHDLLGLQQTDFSPVAAAASRLPSHS